MEDGWKVRMNICTAFWSFVNFCCLSQSEVSTDNRKVSTFFAFQHVRCRYCYRSYLDRFLNIFIFHFFDVIMTLAWTSKRRLKTFNYAFTKCFLVACFKKEIELRIPDVYSNLSRLLITQISWLIFSVWSSRLWWACRWWIYIYIFGVNS